MNGGWSLVYACCVRIFSCFCQAVNLLFWLFCWRMFC
jgi:hypothetical protein